MLASGLVNNEITFFKRRTMTLEAARGVVCCANELKRVNFVEEVTDGRLIIRVANVHRIGSNLVVFRKAGT